MARPQSRIPFLLLLNTLNMELLSNANTVTGSFIHDLMNSQASNYNPLPHTTNPEKKKKKYKENKITQHNSHLPKGANTLKRM